MPGLPFGILITLGGFILAFFVSKMNAWLNHIVEIGGEPDKLCTLALMNCGLGLWACLFVITGICLILFWLFGGCIVGIWFMFGSWEVLADLALARVLIAPSTVMIIALVTLFFH